MSDTIFYTIKLKRTRKPIEVFEKMQKAIKKKGATKRWIYTIDNEDQSMTIDFGDDESETFCLSFNEKKICDSFCKVSFPIEGELFEDEKTSEFKALLNMIWSAKTMFSQMDITDDYGIAEDYLESKQYKLSLRELTEDELALAHELYDSGLTKHSDFIMAVIYRDLEMSPTDKWSDHVNVKIPYATKSMEEPSSCRVSFFHTYVYETAEYKNKRVIHNIDYYMEFSGLWFSVHDFTLMLEELYLFRDFYFYFSDFSFGVKHAQMRRFYRNKIFPQLDQLPDGFEKCCIAYRFFLSAYDFCGFKFVGKEENLDGYKYL